MNIFKIFITIPLGYILGFIYQFVQNYGWSLLLFTVLIKLILLPLGLKQQRSMTRMQLAQPMMNEIQKKYENDKAKQSEEMMKLYKEFGISPMGGCLPMLIQLPILFGLYRVIYQPLTYMCHMGAEKVSELLSKHGITAGQQAEILLAKAESLVNFEFLGLDLSSTPSFSQISWLWVIPILAAGTTFLTSKITTWMNNDSKKEKEEEKKTQRVLNPNQKQETGGSAESTMKTMTYFMPLMTLWIAFTFPAALGFYWIISNVLSIAQTILLNGYYSKKLKAEFEAAQQQKALAEAERKKRKRRRN